MSQGSYYKCCLVTEINLFAQDPYCFIILCHYCFTSSLVTSLAPEQGLGQVVNGFGVTKVVSEREFKFNSALRFSIAFSFNVALL